MNFLILGAGAIGIYIGGRLAEAGHGVTFIARPAAAEALRRAGVRVKFKGGEKAVREVSVFTSPAQAFADGSYDVLVLALKSFDTAAALSELQAVTSAPPPILCLQNGVDNESEIARTFGAERVIAGTVTTAVSLVQAGEIVVERERGVGLALGHALSLQIMEALAGAGFKTRTYPAAGPMKWSKLLVNLIGNATSAILDLSTAELFADRRVFAIERAMLLECLAVMRALKYEVVDLPGVPVRLVAFGLERLPPFLVQPLLGRAVSSGRGKKMPSFHVDLHLRQRQTEVYWLNGAVARHGAELGVPTPVNRILTETLGALSEGRLSKEDFRRKPEALLRLING
jgi:2-dehydropantoate 2-reductase